MPEPVSFGEAMLVELKAPININIDSLKTIARLLAVCDVGNNAEEILLAWEEVTDSHGRRQSLNATFGAANVYNNSVKNLQRQIPTE